MRILFISFLLFFSVVSSAGVLKAPFKPYSVPSTFINNLTTYTTTTFRGLNSANDAVFSSRPVSIPSSTMRLTLVRRLGSTLFNPWLGMTLFLGGLYYDSLTDDVIIPGPFDNDLAPSGYVYSVGSFSSQTKSGACSSWTSWAGSHFSVTGMLCNRLRPPNFIPGDYVESNDIILSVGSANDGPFQFPGSSASDQQVMDFLSSLSHSQLVEILTNPMTNRIDDIQPLLDAASDLTSDYNAENDTLSDGSPDLTTSATVDYSTGDNGIDAIDDVPPENLPEEPDDLCKTNPNILACQLMGDELNQDVIPEEQLPYNFTSETMASNASCPSNPTMITSHGTMTMNITPVCDLASSIRPIFISICSIIALSIVVGAVRS